MLIRSIPVDYFHFLCILSATHSCAVMSLPVVVHIGVTSKLLLFYRIFIDDCLK